MRNNLILVKIAFMKKNFIIETYCKYHQNKGYWIHEEIQFLMNMIRVSLHYLVGTGLHFGMKPIPKW